MRWRIPTLVTASVTAAIGCSLAPANPVICTPDEACDLVTDTAPQAVCTDLCVEEPDDGFTGPNWYWLGSPADMPPCPDTAPLAGIRAYADATPEVQPPCAETQSVQWSFVARECKITTRETCTLAGEMCAPRPPDGYVLCIYQDDEAECAMPAYPTRHRLMRENPDQTCTGMGVEPITLCCTEPPSHA